MSGDVDVGLARAGGGFGSVLASLDARLRRWAARPDLEHFQALTSMRSSHRLRLSTLQGGLEYAAWYRDACASPSADSQLPPSASYALNTEDTHSSAWGLNSERALEAARRSGGLYVADLRQAMRVLECSGEGAL